MGTLSLPPEREHCPCPERKGTPLVESGRKPSPFQECFTSYRSFFWFHGIQAKTFLEAKNNILGLSSLQGGMALLDTSVLISGQSPQGLGESRSETLGTVFSTRLFLVDGGGNWTVCILILFQSLTWLSTLGGGRGAS